MKFTIFFLKSFSLQIFNFSIYFLFVISTISNWFIFKTAWSVIVTSSLLMLSVSFIPLTTSKCLKHKLHLYSKNWSLWSLVLWYAVTTDFHAWWLIITVISDYVFLSYVSLWQFFAT